MKGLMGEPITHLNLSICSRIANLLIAIDIFYNSNPCRVNLIFD